MFSIGTRRKSPQSRGSNGEVPDVSRQHRPEPIRVAVRALVGAIENKIDLYRHWYTEASHLGDLQTAST